MPLRQEPTFTDTLLESYRNIPVVTRILLTGMLVMTVIPNFGLVNPMSIIFDWRAIWNSFEVYMTIYSMITGMENTDELSIPGSSGVPIPVESTLPVPLLHHAGEGALQ